MPHRLCLCGRKEMVMKEKSVLLKKKKFDFSAVYKNKELLIMLIPGFVALILFFYYPLLGNVIAFKKYKVTSGIWGSPWNGIDNFMELFRTNNFGNILKNTIVISFLKLIFGFPAPIILALLLNEVKCTGFKKVVQTCSYLPHFFSWVVLGGIFIMLFSIEGPVNSILKMLGMSKPIEFFGDNGSFLFMVIATAVWQGLGYGAVVYIATLSGIDPALYEAAMIDGAGRWKQAIHISIPHLMPTIITLLIINVGHILNAGYDQIYNMYNPTVYEVADVIDTFVMRTIQSLDYGVGAAADLFKSIVALIMVQSANYISNKVSEGEMGIF